jgi:hypothetical protein
MLPAIRSLPDPVTHTCLAVSEPPLPGHSPDDVLSRDPDGHEIGDSRDPRDNAACRERFGRFRPATEPKTPSRDGGTSGRPKLRAYRYLGVPAGLVMRAAWLQRSGLGVSPGRLYTADGGGLVLPVNVVHADSQPILSLVV